jgi:hypothetical protein
MDGDRSSIPLAILIEMAVSQLAMLVWGGLASPIGNEAMSMQLLQAWHTQKAPTTWAISQQMWAST